MVAMAAGCGSDSGGADASVTGSVTFKGKPVANGTVSFSPQEGKGPGAEAAIADGKYSISKAASGKNKVVVQGFTGMPGSTGEPLFGAAASGATRVVELKPGNQTVDLAVGASKK